MEEKPCFRTLLYRGVHGHLPAILHAIMHPTSLCNVLSTGWVLRLRGEVWFGIMSGGAHVTLGKAAPEKRRDPAFQNLPAGETSLVFFVGPGLLGDPEEKAKLQDMDDAGAEGWGFVPSQLATSQTPRALPSYYSEEEMLQPGTTQ